MGVWASYSLSDLVLFSPQAYVRLYELHNTAVWPLQLPALAIAVGLLLLTRGARATAAWRVLMPLAAFWGVVAWWFFVARYAQINPVAVWFGAGFALQALLLMVAGLWRGARFGLVGWRDAPASLPGVVLMLYAVLVHPLGQILSGRAWGAAEVFGVAPDPTALATLGFLLIARGRVVWLLAVIPLLWCLVSALTHVGMGLYAGVLTPAVAALAVLWSAVARRSERTASPLLP
ncbi:MAG: DUF6064 family protein [Sedimenticolaceae bacterium]